MLVPPALHPETTTRDADETFFSVFKYAIAALRLSAPRSQIWLPLRLGVVTRTGPST